MPAGLPPQILNHIRRCFTAKEAKAIGTTATRYVEFVAHIIDEAEPEVEPRPYGPWLEPPRTR